MALNEKDFKILEKLKENSKLTISEISEKTSIPITTVHNRIKKMEQTGVIKKYTLELNHSVLGNVITAYLMIHTSTMLANGLKVNQEDIVKEMKLLKQIDTIELLAGQGDILVKARVKDVNELNNAIIKQIKKIDGINNIQTMIVLNEY